MKELIQKLVETIGPAGYETNIRELIKKEIHPLTGEVDALGNLIVKVGEKSKTGKKIMLAAHMDEIGIMATHINENGFIRFSTLGGVGHMTLIGSRVKFLNGTEGVISVERKDRSEQLSNMENMFIDVGASNLKECPIKIGDVAGFQRTFLDLGKRLVAKSMDDRIGVAVLIRLLKNIKTTPHEIYFVFSTQEEVGLRGATTAAFAIDPEIGISVDVTLTGDTPKAKKMAVALGKGPAIKIRDGGMLADPQVVEWMVKTAEKARIPYQREILEGGTTDARVMQISRAGMPAGCVSIPCRYVHSPSEMIDLGDVEQAINLLTDLLTKPIQL